MRKKLTKRKNDMPVRTKNLYGVLVSAVVGFASTILLTLLVSLFLIKSSVLSNTVSIYFVCCVIFGAFITGFMASKMCEFKGVVSGIFASLLYALFVTVLMLFFSHGQLETTTGFLYLGILISSAIAGILSANTKRRK